LTLSASSLGIMVHSPYPFLRKILPSMVAFYPQD